MSATPPAGGPPTAPRAAAAGATAPSKAERTREALRAAALRRFVADGFDAAKVADVAADVGVTERTFYRHFATKHEVLFGDFEQRLGWFRSALAERPADEPLVDSALAAIRSFPDDPRLMVEVSRLRRSLLDRHRISGFLRELQGLLADELRPVARARLGDGPDVELRAAVQAEALSGAVFASVSQWTDRAGEPDLAELDALTAAALEQVRPAIEG